MYKKEFTRDFSIIMEEVWHYSIFFGFEKELENIQRSRGFQTEERFMRALENGNGSNPHWYKGVSRGTVEQDQNKIDCVVHTVFGDIFVQIKSSQAGANKFLNKIKKIF